MFSATGTMLATAELTCDWFGLRITGCVDADGNGLYEAT